MPLLSGFTINGERGPKKRWGNTLYNHPMSSGWDYFINNLKDNRSSIMGKTAGFPKTKSENENRGARKALSEGNDSELISPEWMFRIAKAKYRELEGGPELSE